MVACLVGASCSGSTTRHPSPPTTTLAPTVPTQPTTSTVLSVDTASFPPAFWFSDALNGWGVNDACNAPPSDTVEPCVVQAVATTDGGRTWQAAGAASRFVYAKRGTYDDVELRIVMADRNTAWETGGHPMVTHDRGVTWTAEPLPPSVLALDPVPGGAWAWAGGCATGDCIPKLYRLNQGRWAEVVAPSGVDARSLLTAVSTTTAFVYSLIDTGNASQGRLDRTVDGGATWQQVSAPCASPWSAIVTLDQARLWLWCGNEPSMTDQGGVLNRSADGGRTWQVMSDNGDAQLNGGPPAKGNMPMFGYSPDFVSLPDGTLYTARKKFGLVARSTDGGTHWTSLLGDDGSGGYQLTVLDDNVVWAASNQCLYGTIDGGIHWTLRSQHGGGICQVTAPPT